MALCLVGARGGGGALIEQLGCRGLAVVFGTFSVELSRKDVGVKFLVVVVQLVSVHEHLSGNLV